MWFRQEALEPKFVLEKSKYGNYSIQFGSIGRRNFVRKQSENVRNARLVNPPHEPARGKHERDHLLLTNSNGAHTLRLPTCCLPHSSTRNHTVFFNSLSLFIFVYIDRARFVSHDAAFNENVSLFTYRNVALVQGVHEMNLETRERREDFLKKDQKSWNILLVFASLWDSRIFTINSQNWENCQNYRVGCCEFAEVIKICSNILSIVK